MAGYKKIYTSQTDYLYDLAKSQQYFSDEQYAKQVEQANGDNYLAFVATYKDNLPASFNQTEFDKLGDDDKLAYMRWKADKDTTSESYKQNEEYFNQVFEKIKNDEIYNSLNGFEKTLATVGGWFGSLGLGVYGLGEGLLDAASLIGGGIVGGIGYLATGSDQILDDTMSFIGKDVTGYNAAQQALTEFRQAYTFENKQQWMGAINDVFGAIGQMAPMLVTGGASAAVKAIGTTAYYVGMAGNTAEQAVVANPDIEYWKLLTYTGAITGVEALTEWGSGKIFGEGLIGLKGYNPKQISGGMFKTILHNMGTEAAEEAVSEIFGGILEYYLVTEDRESLPTLEKVLYAALIGGITGGVLAGGRIALTPRMSVTSDGQVKYNKNLTTEERESAKKLGLRKSWAVQSLLQQSSDALNSVDEITKLQTKYGNLSLDQIKTQHAAEYQKAVKVDTETKTQQAKSFLSLAKLMNEIGEQNFTEAVDLLNGAVEDAKRMADNYINHRAEGNKKASEVFAANYPNRSFTPSTIPSKTNQTLAETIRKAFPNVNVVFGTFGDKDGDPIRAINGTETYLFVDENFAAKNGTQALVEAVRYQLADQLMSEIELLDKSEADGLVKLFTDTDVPYSKLTKEQKRVIAQILCFDVVNTRKLFRSSPKTHKKMFKYFTDQSEYVKKFGRQTEANKIRYHDLLSIRNMYIQNIVDTIGNMEDARVIAKEYDLSEEELQTKIIDKMMTTNANDVVKLTKLQQVKEACQKRDAFNELYNSRVDNTEDFDFDRMYDADYYSPDFAKTVSQNNADFKQALQEYILAQHGIAFVDKTEFDIACDNMLSVEMVEQFSKDFLTKEFLDTNPSYADKKAAVVEAIYMLSQTGADLDGDSVIVTDTKIEGTGKLRYFKGDVYERFNILGAKQDGTNSENTGKELQRTISKTRTYKTEQISYLRVAVQEETSTSLEKYQKDIIRATKKAYGMNVKFFKNSPIDLSTSYPLDDVKGFIVVSKNTIYVRDDASVTEDVIVKVVRHEVVHHLLNKIKTLDPTQYTNLITKAKNTVGDEYWNELKETIKNTYKRETSATIEEEVLVSILNDEIYIDERVDIASLEALQNSVFENAEYNNPLATKPRLSVSDVDDLNRKLTEQQKNYFKKSVVRDSMGRLLTMYHGTSNGGFTIYDIDKVMYGLFGKGFYHTENPDVGRRYSKIRRGDKQQVYEVYMNITNPIDMDAEGVLADWIKAVPDAEDYFPKTGANEDFFRALEDYMAQEEMIQDDAADFIITTLTEMGYDGITHVGGKRVNQNDPYHRVYIAFYPEQIKSVYNANPTENPDIMFSKDKTPKKNVTEKDIAQLASTDYRSGKKDFSKAKGYEGREYEVASVVEYENKNGELLRRKIKTIEDLKTVLNAIKEGKIGSPESGFVMNLIQSTVLTFNFKGKRYAAAKAIFDEIQGPRQTYQAEEFASRSELFAQTNPMKALSEELSQKHGTEIQPSEKMMIKWVPMYADRTNWLNRIQQEYDQLIDKRKHTQDPYTREQINEELKYLRTLASAVAEDDTATILDLTIQKLQKSDENKIQNETTIQEMTRDFVADLIQHTDTSGPVKYNPNKKYILKPEHAEKIVDFWKKVNAFRYLAMLSSPATWGRNALTNTLVCVNALVEDVIGGKIEQSRLLRQESQANFTGNYDKNFSDAVEKRYATKVQNDTAGDKYHSTELEAVRQKWAEANDPMKKSKLLGKIKAIEQKMLNDQPWTKRRVMRNLKNMLAGSMNMISKNAYAELKGMYKGNTAEEIYTNMLDKGSPLAEEFKKVYIDNKGADMVGVLELAAKLTSTSGILDQIYDKALYRGNKLLFKTDNILSKKIGKLQDKHPMTAAFITAIVPFARTSFNTSAYIVNHSPLGVAKGIIQAFQTRNMYYGDMRQAITDYHRTEYVKQHKEANKDFKFVEAEFKQWCNKHLSGDVVSAINGDYKSIKSVFDQYVKLGRVSQSLVGSSDIFARATSIESISQGLTGTGLMVLGILLATMMDGFKIDEDDYLGPVLQVGDLRFKLDDLSPFSTLFSVGAVINSSEGVLDGFEKFAGILIDSSMLNVVESAIQYSDSIPDYLGNQQINFVQQFIPAIFKSFTKVIDNAKKDKSGNFYEKLIKTTASNLPLFSYLVADKIDPYTGEKEKIYQSGLLEAAFHQVLPVGIRSETMSDFEREARRIGAETTGLSGSFKVNDIDYDVKDKQKYSKYKAEYINEQYYLIKSGKQKVTVENDKGKRITTTYDKLTDKQKQNVINRLYTDATSMTKIKWWTDQGNKYVVTDRDLYKEYRKMFSNIVYKKNWSKSKFVES